MDSKVRFSLLRRSKEARMSKVRAEGRLCLVLSGAKRVKIFFGRAERSEKKLSTIHPKLRFRPADGSEFPEWREMRLGDIYRPFTQKNKGEFDNSHIISVATMTFIPQKDVDPDYLRTYNILPLNAIAFEGNRNKAYSYGKFVLNDIGEGLVSHVFRCFVPCNEADMDSRFWKYYIHYEPIMGPILMRSTKASTMMHEVVPADFAKQKILVPSHTEQSRIGALFVSIDTLISEVKAELADWRELKKGLLQQMLV